MACKRTLEVFSSPSSSSPHVWNYDVFLSFRGEDTRKNFTDHLYFALKDAGINTYRDDNELPRGENITNELLNEIQQSRISLIVFSRNYGASRWCLDELVKIMECRTTVQQVVLPIFYDVNPSDVRKQSGSFGKAFGKLEEHFIANMDKVSRWRDTLSKAADLSGWDLTSAKDGYEAATIKNIVEEILSHLNNTYLNVAKYPVGIDSRVRHMNNLLHIELNDVRIIGICATGGMGKTTVAKAVFNQLFGNFQDKSFLANVREISKQPNGQLRLQKQLLFDILKMKTIKVTNVDRGMNVIKERLCNRRVLLVLDDVDQSGQLNQIIGKRDWFGLGSRIIITTRDEHLLKEIEVDDIYMLDGLNFYESFELFSWNAFKKSHPKEDYIEFSKDVIHYCKGLPLALEVLGSFLFGRSIPEWKSALEKSKRTPHEKIQKQLRISYEALEDNNEKAIFLDIACFFIGVDKDYLVKILDGCGFFAEIGIGILIQRCLININIYNKITMHDLIRDMGREIVREESPNEMENHSRLWFYDEVLDILTKHKGTIAVQGLVLKLPSLNKVCLSTKAFAKMHKLRLLQLSYVHDLEGNDDIFEELRLLCWHGFPWKVIPNNFHVENLVAIDMQYSRLRQVWSEFKVLKKLKFLNLSHSHSLTKTPDFIQLPNLEELVLKDCTRLVEIHPSIGHLGRLVLLNMRDCNHLKILPVSICQLKSLRILNLSNCSKIETLPENLGEMEALIEFHAGGTAIRQVPSSIVHLKNLKELSLFGCKFSTPSSLASDFWSWVSRKKSLNPISLLLPTPLLRLGSLKFLNLQDCNVSDEAIPKDLGSLSSLISLNLDGNNFRSLPASIKNLSMLRELKLRHCTRLQSLPELPTSLLLLLCGGCISLEKLIYQPKLSNLSCFISDDAYAFEELPRLGESQFFSSMDNELANISRESLLQRFIVSPQEPAMIGVVLPSIFESLFIVMFPMRWSKFTRLVYYGNEIPQWFSHQWTGPSSSFRLPTILGCKIVKGIALCALYVSRRNSHGLWLYSYSTRMDRNEVKVKIVSTTPAANKLLDLFLVNYFDLEKCHVLYGGDEVKVKVTIEGGGESNLKKFGIRLLYDEYDEAETTIQSNSGELIQWNSASNQNAIVVGDDDNEAGPSHGWSDEDPLLKRPRYQVGSSENTTGIDDHP